MTASARKPKVIVSVINDLSTDQRVDRTCMTLTELGFEVCLVGRSLPESKSLEARPYATLRFKLPVHRGPIFYLLYNLRLLLHLLLNKADLLLANDLDTLPANGIAARLRRTRLVYDSHELFVEVPELMQSMIKRKLWSVMEDYFAPKADAIITVNDSIAEILSKRFGRDVNVVRNIPRILHHESEPNRKALSLPADKRILILQGSGINIDRGAEEAVMMMQYLEGYLLLIAGSGDVIPNLKVLANSLSLEDKVIFLPRQPYAIVMQYTSVSDAGLSLDKGSNLNYQYSLPNKVFDYIQAGIPVISSNLPEIRKIVEEYQLGLLLSTYNPAEMAAQIEAFLSDDDRMKRIRENLKKAAGELNWEHEKEKLIRVIADICP